MPFRTYFDAQAEGLFAYWPVALPLVFFAGTVWWASLDGRTRGGPFNLPAYLRGFGALLAAVSAFVCVVATIGLVHRQAEIKRIFVQRDFTVVEGAVSDFQPDPTGGHQTERFRVGSTWLTYRGPVETGGFHQTRADGGPIADGRRVRMVVDRQGRILKLDIAE